MNSGTWLSTDDDLADLDPFRTIDDLFDAVDGVVMGPNPIYSLTASYHPTLGYPTDISFYGAASLTVADAGGFSVSLTDYEPISPDAPLTPTPTPDPDADELLAELAEAKALWASKASDDYTIEYVHSSIRRGPLRLTIREGVIESARLLEPTAVNVEFLPQSEMGNVLTIGRLFDWAEEQLSVYRYPAWKRGIDVRVEYDPDFGYPREISVVDLRDPSVAFDPVKVSLRSYEPLDPLEISSLPVDSVERHASVLDLYSDGDATLSVSAASTVEDVLEKGLRLVGASPVHLATRGTATADSARCDWRGIARTAARRKAAIRCPHSMHE